MSEKESQGKSNYVREKQRDPDEIDPYAQSTYGNMARASYVVVV